MSREKYVMPFCVISSVITIPMEVMWVQSCATLSRSDPGFSTGHRQTEQWYKALQSFFSGKKTNQTKCAHQFANNLCEFPILY